MEEDCDRVNEYKYNNMNNEKRAETNLVAYGNSFITVNSLFFSLFLSFRRYRPL